MTSSSTDPATDMVTNSRGLSLEAEILRVDLGLVWPRLAVQWVDTGSTQALTRR